MSLLYSFAFKVYKLNINWSFLIYFWNIFEKLCYYDFKLKGILLFENLTCYQKNRLNFENIYLKKNNYLSVGLILELEL